MIEDFTYEQEDYILENARKRIVYDQEETEERTINY